MTQPGTSFRSARHPPSCPLKERNQVTDDRLWEHPASADRPAEQVADPPEDGSVSRFHSAHSRLGGNEPRPAEPPLDVLLAIAGRDAAHGSSQLQQQAAELAQHLHARERELMHREATLNARSAAHDDQMRSARLVWQEQQVELADREAELGRRQRLLEQQEEALQQRQAHWQEEQRAQQQAWEQQAQDLQAQCAATATLQGQLRQRLEEHRQLTEQLEQHRTRHAELQRLHTMLQERQARLDDDRHAWELDKERQQQRILQQRLAIARHWRFRGQTLQMQQQILRQRREQLDQRQQALSRLQTELQHARRELLEVQLAVEWARHSLSACVAPSDLATIHQRVRGFVAAELAALESTRQQQQLELQTLATSLTQQQASLAARHETMQRWAQERQQELETQVGVLDQRERELEQLYEQLARDKQVWLAALDDGLAQTLGKMP